MIVMYRGYRDYYDAPYGYNYGYGYSNYYNRPYGYGYDSYYSRPYGYGMIVLTDMIADGEPLALPPAIIKHERALLTYS